MLFIEKLPTRYDAGLASVTAGQKTVTPTNAAWLGNAWGDDLFFLPSQPLVPPQRIEAVNDDGTLTLAVEWPGSTETEVAYEIRYVGIIERSTAQTRAVLEQLGDVKAYYDVQVDTLADRAGFDSRPAGYRVLVSDIGDGRAAIYSKASSADGDWTDPAYFSGPVGPMAEVTVGSTTTLAPGSSAAVTPTPTPSGVELAFGIPAGRGATPRGDYNPATTYVLDDAVLDNGSTWIALQSTIGNAPPVLPATSNAWWHLLAQAGQDGTGTGDVQGPSSSVADRIAVFSGTTGKQLKDGGMTLAELTPDGYDDLLVTVSLLALQVADNSNAALFLGTSGNRVADSFDTLTYVDVAGATNLDTTTPGVLKPTASSANTLVNIGLDATSSSWAGNNLRQVYAAGVLSTSGSRVRMRLRGPFTNTTVVAGMTIGHKAATGNAWDMDSAPVPVTVGGQASFTLATGADVWTDWIDFAFDEAKDFIVAIYQASASYTRIKTGLSASYNVYYKASGSEIATAAPAGYSTIANRADCVEQIDVSTGINNMTVRSTGFIAASAPAKAKALLRVKEIDTAAAGVDYTLECSRDDGANWSVMTLTELFTAPSPTAGIRVVEAGETDISSQPSGTTPRWRFKTLNNKSVEIHDAYFYWS
ncbi:MAG: hypothetical protein ABS76_15585 [Pelagibacterium sp. SCN 64-44]|nr:MAG: hypothetical protein ABS76_15585 [Pelagibacterium sp. SCN 64-44]